MNGKIYILSMSIVISTATPAHAGMFKKCMAWLESLENPPAAPAPLLPSRNEDYKKYMRERAKNPHVLPPTALVEYNTTPQALTSSFFYWWYPGNAYGYLMVPKNKKLAAHLLMGGTVADYLLPTEEQKAMEAAALAKHPVARAPDEVEASDRNEPSPRGSADFTPDDEEQFDTSPTKDVQGTQGPRGPSPSEVGASFTDSGITDSGPPVDGETP